jgi:dynein heavy chain 1, cytosolic
VKPLRDEVEALEAQASGLKKQQEELVGTITAAERSITTYKEEYASLISETQRIKTEMTTVKTKVLLPLPFHSSSYQSFS